MEAKKREFLEKISTQSIIVETSISLHHERIFDKLPINDHLGTEAFDIVLLYCKNRVKGDINLLKKKKNVKSFRNSMNVLLKCREKENKLLNIKVTDSGLWQLCGCKDETLVKKAIQWLSLLLLKVCPEECQLKNDNTLSLVFRNIMCNIAFSLDFELDKMKLSNLIDNENSTSENTHVFSNRKFLNLINSTAFGYTGCNVKLPLSDEVLDKIMTEKFEYNIKEKTWSVSKVKYEIFKRSDKTLYNTFLCFNSGKVIMSGINIDTMIKDYEIFSNFLKANREKIEECLLPSKKKLS